MLLSFKFKKIITLNKKKGKKEKKKKRKEEEKNRWYPLSLCGSQCCFGSITLKCPVSTPSQAPFP